MGFMNVFLQKLLTQFQMTLQLHHTMIHFKSID